MLIDLLGELSPEPAWPIEYLLHRIAGDKVPAGGLRGRSWTEEVSRCLGRVVAGRSPKSPCRRENLQPLLGYTLVVIPDGGTVYELGRDGKPRWKIDKLDSPFGRRSFPEGAC